MTEFKIKITNEFKEAGVLINVYQKNSQHLTYIGTSSREEEGGNPFETIITSTSITLNLIAKFSSPPYYIRIPRTYTEAEPTSLQSGVDYSIQQLNNTDWELTLSEQNESTEPDNTTTTVEIRDNQP